MNFKHEDTLDYKYNNHLEIAKDLFQFAEKCLEKNDNISFRMGIGRLYYAFYHKILHENEEKLKSKESKQMHWHLFNNNGLPEHYRKSLLLLQKMRKWADYQTESHEKEVNIRNLLAICQRIFEISIKIK
ncbi:hypothetical protein [Campylobacter sp. CCS1377]|uniref:HEPN domain-containing protein n=1 Tax=Campylobacter sp. CCS1377 TaxID=3158229 RepID=A0AAU7E4I8_9BACT